MSRIHYIDTVKGVGILFVIMGHHWVGADALRGWISSFHMPLFFMITGFLLANRNKIYKNVKQLVNEKARTLLYPYFTFSMLVFIWYILFYVILPNKPEESIQCVFIKTITTYGYHALWFLPTLFFSTILFLLINKRKKAGLIFIVFIAGGGILSLTINIPCIKEMPIWYIFNYFTRIIIATGFIYLGSIWKCIDEKIQNRKIIEWIIIILTFLCSLFLYRFNFDKVNIALSKTGNPFLFYILAVAGSIFVILLCKQLNLHHGFLNFIGRNSLIFMAIHMEFPVEIAWIIVGISGLTTSLPLVCSAGIVIIIELIIESICVILLNKYFKFMLVKQ